ncbi:MAG: hypothetical protein ACREPM_10610 [Gemmatimonadaceae bacterium]
METLTFLGGSITGLPFLGEHSDLAMLTKFADLVQLGHGRLLCAADSSNIEQKMHEHANRALVDIDALFLGWSATVRPSDGCSRRYPSALAFTMEGS